MDYFPIFQELFKSDTVYFLLIGLVVAFWIGLIKMKAKTRRKLLFTSIGIYVLSEVVLNLHQSYMLGFAFLFLGTFSIGAFIGIAFTMLINKFGKKANDTIDLN